MFLQICPHKLYICLRMCYTVRMRPKHVLLQLGYTSKRRLESIAAFAKEHNWFITLEDNSALPRGWSGDGVLTLLRAGQPRLVAYARRLMARGIPVVDLSVCHPEIRMPRVVGDHAAIGALAADHFAEHRFRHVALFTKDWTHTEELRFGGFRRRWRGEAPLELCWRKAAPGNRYDDWGALIRWLAARLAAAPRPLAVFAFNDADAARVLVAAQAAGLSIPEEVAILGVDDESIIVENQSVPLSSVRHDLAGAGREAAALLDRLMDGEPPPRRPVLVPPLGIAVRRSTDVIAVSSPVVRRALSLVAEHLADAYGASELAADLGISRATLNRIFAAELESSPSAEFLRQRIARARLLLSTTDYPMKAVAASCGFCDSAHLANVFRRETGVTPSDYRGRQGSAS